MGRRERRGRRQWEEVVRAQEKSGLSVQAFCLRESVGTASFYTWRRRLREMGTAAAAEEKTLGEPFIDLGRIGSGKRTMSLGAHSLEVTLDFGEGFTLTVRRG
jgi:putative transposase